MVMRGGLEMSLVQLKENQYLYGQVVQGKQLGRTIGFPTANIKVEVGIPLQRGVYGVYVYHQGKRHIGVMNVGKRPTFDDGEHQTYEVHILDFSKDIYNQKLTIEVLFYIRPEQKFNQLTELVQQLHADVFRARKQFRFDLNPLQ